MKDPYEILDLPQDSDFEVLKQRYEELKKKYGEERFLPGEQGAEGAKKLTELEDAWSIIAEKQRVKEDESRYGVGFEAVKKLILEKKYDEAQARLDAMNNRDGEWHYYQAILYYKREWLNDSYTHLKEAVRLSPDNQQYKDSLAKMSQTIGNGNVPPSQLGGINNGIQDSSPAYNCLSNCCSALCCMECLSLPFRCCG